MPPARSQFVSPDEFDEDPIVGNHPSRSPSPSSTTPLDPLYNLLSSRERNLCRHLNLPPAAFLDATAHLEDECKRRGGLNESEASALSSWRVWETGQWNGYWTHLLRFGYVWVPSRKRGRQQIGDETALLHRVQPMYRTVEDGVATVKYADLQAEEPKRRIGKDRGALEPPKQVRTGDDELFVETNERIIWRLVCWVCFIWDGLLTFVSCKA